MRLHRIIAIIMCLLQKDKTTAENLSTQFEVSVRTIYRDIDTINDAGIPICSLAGAKGGIWILPEYKVDKGIFTTEDLVYLLMGTGIITNSLNHKNSTINIINKIKSFIPKTLENDIQLKSDAIEYVFDFRNSESLKKTIDETLLSINLKNLISFNYWSNGTYTNRTIEPYKLIFQANSWYVQGYCLEKNDFRIFKFSRMWDLKKQDIIFKTREIPKAFSDYNKAMKNSVSNITLIVDFSILDRVLDHCPISNITPIENSKYKIDFPFIDNDYDYGILLSFGDKCECISPKSVKNNLITRIKSMTLIYS